MLYFHSVWYIKASSICNKLSNIFIGWFSTQVSNFKRPPSASSKRPVMLYCLAGREWVADFGLVIKFTIYGYGFVVLPLYSPPPPPFPPSPPKREKKKKKERKKKILRPSVQGDKKWLVLNSNAFFALYLWIFILHDSLFLLVNIILCMIYTTDTFFDLWLNCTIFSFVAMLNNYSYTEWFDVGT